MSLPIQQSVQATAEYESSIYIQQLLVQIYTVQSLYNTPRYNTGLDIAQSCCGSNFLPWNFTKEL